MCGISFVHDPTSGSDDLRQLTHKALAAQAHRGPDDSGIWTDSTTAIGHRRLSIIDVAASRQPMVDRSGRFVMSYNGEIYNYAELRVRLSQYWQFQTSGDTEVLLAGLILHGESFLSQLEGMWAFALWDTQTKTLLIGRDRLGKKPLFYQASHHSFACASELQALRKLCNHAWQEDLAGTADYFRYGYYLPGTTAYHDVRELLPGHTLRWSAENGTRQTPYWRLPVGGYTGSYKQACAELKHKMINAVRRRMVADVEVGAFLSGGIDSSLIVGIMTQELGVHPKTFTIGFENRTYDESEYAQATSQHWGVDHYQHRIRTWDRELLTQLVLEHVGQPFCDSSLLPTAEVSRLAARHVKVVLSGDGGDELFSGYQRYQARMLLRWYTRLPHGLRGTAKKLIRCIPEPFAHHSRSLLKKTHLFFEVADRLESETPYVAPVFYSRQEFEKLAPDLAAKGHDAPALPQECRADAVQEMMVGDGLVYLPQDILAKVDRASMAYSLEARCPFLDRDVVEFTYSLPRHWHRDLMKGKRLLRDTFSYILPPSVLRRRKQGFAVPVHDWFRQELGTELETLLQETPTLLRRDYVLALLNTHRAGRRDHGYRLWGIYVYLLWLTNQKKHAF